MAIEVVMPQMGESIAEGTITRWLAKAGDRVARDQPLFEISTDKVDAEIPSPADGVVLEIKFPEGATVGVNEVVALLGEPGEQPSEPEPSREESEPAATATIERPQVELTAAEPEEKGTSEGEEAKRVRKYSSPVVRKMAAETGVDLAEVSGTGIHGRVTKRDLEEYLAGRGLAGTGELPSAPVTPPVDEADRVPGVPVPLGAEMRGGQVVHALSAADGGFSIAPYTDQEKVEIVPMSRIRQITAAHMVYSKATSAHVTTVFDMDLSRVARIRRQAKDGFAAAHGTKLTFMPFVFRAVANALKANPKLNASIDRSNIVYKKEINLGMAVAMERGLIVPVIRDADQLSLVGLAKAANDLADRARSKKLYPHEVQGGTFTVTNPGVFGSLFGTPIINQPQVAILGIGVIEKRPIVETDSEGNDILAIKTMSYFAITFDHRLIDGADADRFMVDIKRTLAEEAWSELDPYL
jgi:2-oxoglutarate dehydrogenase E2 component (dihydrolipoamide succinyltransferase)